MDDALGVCVGHRLADAQEDVDRAGLGPLLVARGHMLEHLLQGHALHELHREVGAALGVDAQVVDGDDAGVIELSGHARLVEEAAQPPLADGAPRCLLAAQDLHREAALDVLVPDLEDGPHPPARDLLLDAVVLKRAAAVDQALEHLLRHRLVVPVDDDHAQGMKSSAVRSIRRSGWRSPWQDLLDQDANVGIAALERGQAPGLLVGREVAQLSEELDGSFEIPHDVAGVLMGLGFGVTGAILMAPGTRVRTSPGGSTFFLVVFGDSLDPSGGGDRGYG